MKLAEIQERFPEMKERLSDTVEQLHDPDVEMIAAGTALAAGGVATGVVNLLRGQRHARAWVIPLILLASGTAFAATGLLRRRSSRMETAEIAIAGELDRLDPVARAQVLKHLAEDEVYRVLPER